MKMDKILRICLKYFEITYRSIYIFAPGIFKAELSQLFLWQQLLLINFSVSVYVAHVYLGSVDIVQYLLRCFWRSLKWLDEVVHPFLLSHQTFSPPWKKCIPCECVKAKCVSGQAARTLSASGPSVSLRLKKINSNNNVQCICTHSTKKKKSITSGL